jgi:hypothetical protein
MDNVSTSYMVNWWASEEQDVHNAIFSLVSKLQMEQQTRMDKNIRCLQMYGSPDLLGGVSYAYANTLAANLPDNRVKINIVASMCDTVSSILGKMRARITFLTDKGDAGLQTQAKKLTQYIDGAFYLNDIYNLHKSAFRDATVMDIGALKHFIRDDKIVTERVLATELFFDAADCVYGRPTHMYQHKIIHKTILAEMYPEHRAAINSSSTLLTRQGVGAQPELDDFVVVIEAWKLPVGKDKKFGRHVISVQNGTLLDEKYEKDYFPFTFFKWSPPMVGFVGQSLADRLAGNQVEINKMLRIIQKSFHLGSAFKVFLEYGSKVVKEHLNNDIGSIVYYSGTPPQFYVPKVVNEEYFRHLEWLITNSYQEAGISQLTAASKKPAGLESGRALREYNDIQTDRFASVSQDYEASYLETARQYIDLSKELAAAGVDFKVKGQSRKFIESIAWSDIDIEEEAYVMKMFPTSVLPTEPAGRLAYVQELMNAGLIPQEWALELLDFPDIGSYTSLETAATQDILDTIDEMINHGKYTPPEPYQNLKFGMKTMQAAYLRGKHDNIPDARLDLLRRWISQADKMQQKAVAAAQIGAPAQAAAQGIDQAAQMAEPAQAEAIAPPAPIPGV